MSVAPSHDDAAMASTHLSLHYHIVFGTKDRMPLIHASWRARLHEYLGGTVRGLDGVPEAVGGVADHVHLSRNPKTIRQFLLENH